MPIDLLRLQLRILQRVRRPKQASDERIDQPPHRRRNGLKPLADGAADFAEGALDLVAGGIAEVAGGGEDGSWGVGRRRKC